MDQIENERETARELTAFAGRQGIHVEQLRHDAMFLADRRWVIFWRTWDEGPAQGPSPETKGLLHYSLQGSITDLPARLKESRTAFRGVWTEAGTLEDQEHALQLLSAWLIDRKEVDALPCRSIQSYGI
jgi:hypothetical protein